MKEFVDFLGEQPPFDSLDAEDLARLVVHLEVECFAAGATVVREGQPMTHLWVVRTGALEVVPLRPANMLSASGPPGIASAPPHPVQRRAKADAALTVAPTSAA